MFQNYTPKSIGRPKTPIEKRFWQKVAKTANPDECWNWTAGCFPNGYGSIRVDGVSCGAHRVAYELTFGGISDELFVLHKCDNPPCCNPSHLFLGTHQKNMADMYQKGRGNHPSGDRSPIHKLTDEQVLEIRQRYGFRGIGGKSGRELAKMFGVSFQLISQIVYYKNRA